MFTVSKSLLYLSKIFIFTTFFINMQLSMANASNGHSSYDDVRIMTIEDFQKALDSNEFLKSHGLSGRLNKEELRNIDYAYKLATKSVGGEIRRHIKDFIGNTLVIGAGKKVSGRGRLEKNIVIPVKKIRTINQLDRLESALEEEKSFLEWLRTEEAKKILVMKNLQRDKRQNRSLRKANKRKPSKNRKRIHRKR